METADHTSTFYAPAEVLCIDPGGGRMTSAEARGRLHAARSALRRVSAYRAARSDRAVMVDVVGPAVLVAFFTDAPSAVTCATEFAERWMGAGHTDYRIGVHSGPVLRREEISDAAAVQGPGAALAQAVMECADPGHILLSETVGIVALDTPGVTNVGRVEVVPGLPLRILSLVRGDVGRASTPTRIAQLDAARTARLAPRPLPSMPGRFVGRDAEVSEIAKAFTTARTVSLVGPAGIGKTRIALEAAARLGAARPDGPWFADLTAVLESSDVPWAVARAVGLREFGREPALDRMERYLSERDGILVLDGCEGVATATVGLIARLTSACPRLNILATTREPLSVDGARHITVGGLAVPDAARADVATLVASPAVSLFERRAYEANRDFRVTDAMLEAVAALCAAAGGSPNAICLAAAATAVDAGAPEETLADARQHAGRDAPHAGGMVAWACASLPAATRGILERLSTFDGWFDEAAAVAVCDIVTSDDLRALALRGLLQVDPNACSYHLPRLVAAVLHERAAAPCGDTTAALSRATYYASVTTALDDGAVDDAESALAWVADRDRELALRLATRLSAAWRARGDWERAERWHSRLLQERDGVEVSVLAAALTARSRARIELGDADGALADAEEALGFASSVDDRPAVAMARQTQGQALVALGSIDDGIQRHEQALATLRRVEMRAEEAHTLADLAAASLLAQDADKAMAYCLEGLRVSADVDSSPAESSLMVLRGIAAAQSGDYARAQDAFAAALGVHRRADMPRHEASNLLWQARLAARASDRHSEALYQAERVEVLRRVGAATDIAQALRLAAVAACRGRRLSAAREFAREEAKLRNASDDRLEAARALLVLASADLAAGGVSAALSTLETVASKADDDTVRALCVAGMGVAAHLSGSTAEAGTLLAAFTRWRREREDHPGDAVLGLYTDAALAALAALQSAMPADAFARAAARGNAMDIGAAMRTA